MIKNVGPVIGNIFILQPTYTVFGLEVTFFKHLEMTEKQNKLYLKCLYLQEYKKGFAFLTKISLFQPQRGAQWCFENAAKNFWPN